MFQANNFQTVGILNLEQTDYRDAVTSKVLTALLL